MLPSLGPRAVRGTSDTPQLNGAAFKGCLFQELKKWWILRMDFY
jgi:hypothetical protein